MLQHHCYPLTRPSRPMPVHTFPHNCRGELKAMRNQMRKDAFHLARKVRTIIQGVGVQPTAITPRTTRDTQNICRLRWVFQQCVCAL